MKFRYFQKLGYFPPDFPPQTMYLSATATARPIVAECCQQWTDDRRLLITVGVQLCVRREERAVSNWTWCSASRGSLGVSRDLPFFALIASTQTHDVVLLIPMTVCGGDRQCGLFPNNSGGSWCVGTVISGVCEVCLSGCGSVSVSTL